MRELFRRLFPNLIPDAWTNGVADIDFNALREKGKEWIILDLDNTIAPKKGAVTEETASYLIANLHTGTIKGIYIITNPGLA